MRVAIVGPRAQDLAHPLQRQKIRWQVVHQPEHEPRALCWLNSQKPCDVVVILPFLNGYWDASTLALCLKLDQPTCKVVLVAPQAEGVWWNPLATTQADAILTGTTLRLGIVAVADRLTALAAPKPPPSRLWPADLAQTA